MKFTYKGAAVLLALLMVLTVCLTACSDKSNPQYFEYNYDLSKYITLGEYKGVELKSNVVEVSDEDMKNQIVSMLAEHGEAVNLEDDDRALASGDTVIFRSTVTLDGEVIPELCEESGTFVVGVGHYGEDIDNVLIGAKQGETVYAKRTLEAIYDEYAGKTVDYEIYILGGYSIIMPNYTDALVKAYYGFETIEEFEDVLYQTMYASRKENNMNFLVSQGWRVVVDNATVIEYPEKELDEMVDYLIMDAQVAASSIGFSYEEYINMVYGQTPEEFEAAIVEQAKADLKADMVLYAIARAENLKVTEERYNLYLDRFLINYNDFMYPYEIENTFGKELLMSEVLKEIVKEYIVEVANITYAESETTAE